VLVADTHCIQAGTDRLEDLLDVFGVDHVPHRLAHALHDATLAFMELVLGDVTGDTMGADVRPSTVQTVSGDGEMSYIHLDVAGDATAGAQPHFHASSLPLTRASLVEGAAHTFGILRHQELTVVPADDLIGGVPQQVPDFSIGEGEVSAVIQDVDEVRAIFDQSPIAGLGEGQFLQRAVVVWTARCRRVGGVLFAHNPVGRRGEEGQELRDCMKDRHLAGK